jgi:hypothetical protein
MLRDAGVRGLVADTGETLAFCRFADDLELIVHPDDIGLALVTLDIFCAGTGMALNRSKCEGLWIGRRHDSTARPVMAAPGSPHSLVSASAEPLNLPAAEAERRQAADARRLPWLPPGSSVRVLGVQVGPDADGRDEGRGIANSMMTAMRRWTRTPLTYRARVAILKTLVWSRASFMAMYRTPPDGLLDTMCRASKYFLYKGRLPMRATIDSPARV